MATSTITTPVTLPFNNYKWLWATWTAREIFKSDSVFPSTIKIMYKYNGLPYNLNTSTGSDFHNDLLRLNLTDDSGRNISFSDPSGRSFLRGYQAYWTNTGVLIPPRIVNNNIQVTDLGKALATGKISYTDFIQIIVSRFQLPSLATQMDNYQDWISNGLVFKPFIYILRVLLELYRQGDFKNSYITEQEMAILLVPLLPSMTPAEVANEILAWREGDPSFNISYQYVQFATTANTYRNIKEFLQFLSIGEQLVNSVMNVKSFTFTNGGVGSTISSVNCYFLNTFEKGKWGQITSDPILLQKLENFCNDADTAGYFNYSFPISDNEKKKSYVEYLGKFDLKATVLPFSNPKLEYYIEILKTNKQIIFAGAPGIGKTRNAYEIANSLQANNELALVETILFHQSTSYEDFIEGIRPNVNSNSLNYSYRSGKFKLLCEKARLNPDKYFLLIIDEINRGDISSIFGELIFLLEPFYRKPEYQIELQYTGDNFWVPENVLIIGTMNTIDKSAVEIDLALRRRFKYITLKPDSEVIKEELSKNSIVIKDTLGNVIDLPKVHEKLNDLIADDSGLGEEFCIGHSFFLPKPNVDYTDDYILDIWNYNLIPLLNEYLVLSPRLKYTLSDFGFNIFREKVVEFDLTSMFNTINQLSR